MATKTISIDLVAYDKLNSVRLGPRDSFSQIIHRAHWDHVPKTCGSLLSALASMPVADEDVLKRLEAAQLNDAPPDDSWG